MGRRLALVLIVHRNIRWWAGKGDGPEYLLALGNNAANRGQPWAREFETMLSAAINGPDEEAPRYSQS